MHYKNNNIEILNSPSDNIKSFTHNRENCLIQQTVEWAKIIHETEKDEMFFLINNDDNGNVVGLLTVFIHRSKFGNIMISVPSFGGYGGVVYDSNYNSEEIYCRLISRMIDLAKDNNCVTVTISTAPFFAEETLYNKYFQPDFVLQNFYQYFDLKNPFWESISSKQRNNIKRNLKKAKNENLIFHFTDNNDEFEQWYQIHKKRMNELGVLTIPKSFFYSIFENLEYGGNYWFSTVSYKNKIINGCLFVGNGKTVDIFMQSGDSKYFDLQGNTLLIYEAVRYFQAKGFEYLNWQSSSSKNSGVYEFKKNWGTIEKNHRYLTKITGDISKIRRMSIREIKQIYGNRYVIPYNELRSS